MLCSKLGCFERHETKLGTPPSRCDTDFAAHLRKQPSMYTSIHGHSFLKLHLCQMSIMNMTRKSHAAKYIDKLCERSFDEEIYLHITNCKFDCTLHNSMQKNPQFNHVHSAEQFKIEQTVLIVLYVCHTPLPVHTPISTALCE